MIRRLRFSPSLRRATVVVAVVLGIAGQAAVVSVGRAAEQRFSVVGTWVPAVLPPGDGIDNAVSSTRLVFDQSRRVMWATEGYTPVIVVAYNADTRQPIGKPLTLPGQVSSTALDQARGRFIVAQSVPLTQAAGPSLAPNSSTPELDAYELDGTSLRVAWHADVSSLGVDTELAALRVDSAADALYAAWQPSGSLQGQVHASRFGLDAAAPVPQWSFALPPACPVLASREKAAEDSPVLGFSRSNNAIYLPCAVPDVITSRPPLPGGIGKLSLGPNGSMPAPGGFTLFPTSGDFVLSSGSAFDEATGRLMVDVTFGPASAVTTFDTEHDRYVGVIDGGGNRFTGLGFNERTGRLYAMNVHPKRGLTVGDVRTTPPSQPASYPEVYSQVAVPLFVDAVTSEIYAIYGLGTGHAHYLIVRDTRPPLDTRQATVNPDSNTSDITERVGETAATFNASAQGYGMVLRQVGGVQGVATNADGGPTPINGNSDPELRGAYLLGATLSADEATASSIAADRDQGSTGAQQASVCAASPQQLQPTTCPWPYRPASCSSADKTVTNATDGPSGRASSTCGAAQRMASAHSDYTAGTLGSVDVGALSATATIIENVAEGTRTDVTAEVRDVVLMAGALRIHRVVATARALAHGRPGTAATSFTRSVEGVVLNGTTLCEGSCNLDMVAAQVDAAFPGKLRISFPTPDSGFAKGSPGGYQAMLRLSEADHLDDVLINAQRADRVEVPGMVVVSSFDATRPSRTVLMLAGVEAEARYGIYPLDQFTADQAAGAAPSGFAAGGALTGALPAIATAPAAVAAGLPGASPSASHPVAAMPSIFGWHGWQWAFAHPGEFVRLLAVWLVLLVPVFLSARRWSLLRRHALDMEAAR
jgi:hypothetical protein